MRAHECPQSDLLQKFECTEHQSTNQPDHAQLIVHACDYLKTSESQCRGVSVGDVASVR